MEIGERIQQLREARHMGVSDLGAAMGLGPEAIEAVEAGDRRLSHQEITLLAQVLEVEPDALFSDGDGDDESVENSTLIPTDRLNALLAAMKDS